MWEESYFLDTTIWDLKYHQYKDWVTREFIPSFRISVGFDRWFLMPTNVKYDSFSLKVDTGNLVIATSTKILSILSYCPGWGFCVRIWMQHAVGYFQLHILSQSIKLKLFLCKEWINWAGNCQYLMQYILLINNKCQ